MGTSTAHGVPLLLLDFDGVVNVTRPAWGSAPFQSSVVATNGISYRIRWAPQLTNELRYLHTSGSLEIMWCTSWCGDTAGIEQALVWPPLESAFGPLGSVHAGDTKLRAARDRLALGRRVIWADDTEVPYPGSELYAQLDGLGDILMIRPDGRCGLDRGHMEAIGRFCKKEMA